MQYKPQHTDLSLETARITREQLWSVPAGAPVEGAERPDLTRLRRFRLARLREQLAANDCAGCVLFDPVNIRYATDSSNMSVWTLHNPARYCFVATDGPVILFEFHRCEHLSRHLELIDEIRPATSWFFFGSGPRLEEHARKWASEIADLVRFHGGGNRRLAIDRCEALGAALLTDGHGIEVIDGQGPMELARLIKSNDELLCIREAIRAAEVGMAQMREALHPGMTERELWAILHHANIALGGEWIETRLLTSGERTNPWMQECSDRVIGAGDLVSFDTDMIGPYGYCADISRSFLAGDGAPTEAQRVLYRLAYDQIQHNMSLLKPGVGFREFAEKAWPIPERFFGNRYSCTVHGIGLCDEYPNIVHKEDFANAGFDGVFEAGMTVCVESYIGEVGGAEGVKLEEQVLITETGFERLSNFPFEDRLLGQGG